MKNQVNHFVSFMQQYDLTTADYSKIFDEHTKTVKYNIDTRINQEIIDILKNNPRSLIITGNAGDGKTRICRNVFESLSTKTFNEWPQSGIEQFTYKDYQIRIIKDLSELRDDVILAELKILQDTLNKQSKIYFLIAANEGKLTHFLMKYDELKTLKNHIISQFSSSKNMNEFDNKIEVFNLLHTSSSIYAKQIIDQWNKSENWDVCIDCAKKNQCIIFSNHQSISEKKTSIRINRLYRSLDGNQGHMTMRELLIQLAYTHTGGLNCLDIHNASLDDIQQYSRKSYYENFFGHNLPKEVFEEIKGIQDMQAFDPGYISDSVIDDFIMNGDSSDNETSEEHKKLFGINIDTEYGYFYEELRKYRLNNRSDEDEGKKIVGKWLPRLRRKYYFESNEQHLIEHLVPYKFRKSFLDVLKSEDELDLEIKKDIISGLNIYFSKRMVYSNSNRLYVTSENLYVHEVIDFKEIFFEVPEVIEEYDQKRSFFTLRIDDVKLQINLLTFEYLRRLSNGGMFNVLKEDVEILLNNFRNQLIKSPEEQSILKILKFDSSKGAFVLKEIQIKNKSITKKNSEEDYD